MVLITLIPIVVFVVLLAVLGFLLAAVNRHTRVIGVILLSFLGLVCLAVVGGGVYFAKLERSEGNRRNHLLIQDEKRSDAHKKRVVEQIDFREAEENSNEAAEKSQESSADEGTSSASEAHQLSVDLTKSTSILYPEDRPQWVTMPPEILDGFSTVYVESGPYMIQRECRRKFDEELEQATAEYINEYLDNPQASQYVRYDAKELKARFLTSENTYAEIIQTPRTGPMHQMHALLVFDQSHLAEFDERWHQAVAGSRLVQTGWVAGGIMAFLCVAFGYFKLDTATKGYYTSRLQFLSGAAILALIVAGVLLALWVPWV